MPPSPLRRSLLIAILTAALLTAAYSQPATTYPDCDRTFSCGDISNVTFPFTGGDRPSYCGLPEFALTCRDDAIAELTHDSLAYRVLQVDQTRRTLILSRSDLYDNSCTSDFSNTTLNNSTIFSYGGAQNEALTLFYGCNTSGMSIRPYNLFSCNSSGLDFTDAYYLLGPVPSDPILRIIYCSTNIGVPVLAAAGNRLSALQISLEEALNEGFLVNYSVPNEELCSQCNMLGGQCGFDSVLGQPICICGDRPCPLPPGPGPASPAPSEGVLPDGRVVAVKRLYDNNFKRLEQFMNEVEILTRLRHQNLVKLYGCTSRRSRELLLVYEYIPNGTVADHLHGKRAKSGLLSWPVRLNIAVQTAEALAYLHKSDTIHRDVKTNNILLDNDFHVKVADFGLSRLFPNGATHVSTAPQGTPGYVDPEYYQCYKLTEKSDVYSFGVVLIELISSLQAVDTNRHRHDINLSNMAINKIQNRTLHELVDSSLGFETNSVVRRMVTLVAELAFRCLQQERDMRPSMEEVLEGLRGIQNEDLNAHKVEIVNMSMDDDAELLKGIVDPTSPDSAV
ncbi:hypothetical protein DH2020_012503 [Rehmannia glutinosa]|uniref:non-specific serine/threonine protein kinase n=1 Tax=Rehmannia glutinosa TaxID=99300 RepID=A0ABR0X2L6_REHGL